MKEIQDKLKKAMKNLQDIDFMNYNYNTRKENQRKLNKAYQELDNLAKQRNEVEADLYEANNRIVDLMRIIDEKEEAIIKIKSICINNKPHIAQQKIIKYIEERCNKC